MMKIFIDPVNCGKCNFLWEKTFQVGIQWTLPGIFLFPVPDKNTFVCLTGSLKNISVCERNQAANFCDQHLGHSFHVLHLLQVLAITVQHTVLGIILPVGWFKLWLIRSLHLWKTFIRVMVNKQQKGYMTKLGCFWAAGNYLLDKLTELLK